MFVLDFFLWNKCVLCVCFAALNFVFVFQIMCTQATGAAMTSGRKLEGRIPMTGTSTPSPTLFHGSQVSLSSDFGLTLESELYWNLYLHPLDVKPENNADISRYLRYSRAWGTILSILHRNHQFSVDCCWTIVHYAILAVFVSWSTICHKQLRKT